MPVRSTHGGLLQIVVASIATDRSLPSLALPKGPPGEFAEKVIKWSR